MPSANTVLPQTSARTQASRDNLKGIGWMVAAMAAFALEDAFIKAAARHLPIGEVLMLFGLGGMLAFAAVPQRGGAPLFHRAAVSRPMLVRAVFELVGRLFYVLAVALTPLSSATALAQAVPVLVVLGASLYFRERVGWRRWTAVVVGLVGVLVVLRPAAADFSALSLLTLVGMVGFAGRDLASRAVPKVLGTRHLGFYGFLTVVVAGALYSAWDGSAFVRPAAGPAAALAAAVVIGVLAYACLMNAMRTGDVSTVTPFRYTRLLFGVALGVAVFDERIDGPMLAGCAIIVGAGLAIAWDGRRRRA
jgi:drug/metabolite transporter (DMT)-like permease